MILMSKELDFKLEPEAMNPLALAYIGDAVYELYVRLCLVAGGSGKMKVIHRQAVSFVRAGAQASFLRKLEPLLTEKEKNIVRWGRNAKSGHVPKNAEVVDYRHSTGFEALIGFLYLNGEEERLTQLLGELGQLMEEAKEDDDYKGKTN